MTTRDFIGKAIRGEVKPRYCSSVKFDGKHIYSYGSHYPLLINVAGKWIINKTGYSNTTAKHINWAGDYADYDIYIPNGSGVDIDSPKALLDVVNKNIDTLQAEIDGLKRRGTQREGNLLDTQLKLRITSMFLESVIK